MKTNVLQQKKYNTGTKNYQLFQPLDYEVVIPENDSVRLLSLIMEELALYGKGDRLNYTAHYTSSLNALFEKYVILVPLEENFCSMSSENLAA